MAVNDPQTSANSLLKAQLLVQGAILQVVQKHTGVSAEGIELLLLDLGLSQTEVGLIVGESRIEYQPDRVGR